MHVLFATSQATALTRGGVRTQVLQTKEALENLGVQCDFVRYLAEFSSE